ncbi:dephospho-CoA kinase [Kineosporia sp. J2-2]|uniref:Dephospho-CoA kinase n=1 Tax=Kineosporia corallincola TaxID=2835133 RepID=A0ABS5TCR6_9ACTN|nr:dephospho-CoA kinase [Kineosporia corallincola]MBT0768872.1 dephospho-CoA kinase [Kineosporia corallincola]
MVRTALTGGIGAGKSTVSRRLADLGAIIMDADLIAREVVEPGTSGLAEIVSVFGEKILRDDESLDRPALGRIVFADDEKLARLNAIVHPRVAARMAEIVRAAPAGAVLVYDVPLLAENPDRATYDLVMVVYAPLEERIRRLVDDRGMSREDAEARMHAQATDEQRAAIADVVLDNSGSLAATLAQVDACWRDRIEPLRQ